MNPEEAQHEAQLQVGAHHEFSCSDCGAKLEFTPGTVHLECPYCGASHEIGDGDDREVEERSLHEALARIATAPVSELTAGGSEIECRGCGAKTIVSGHASACPFCDSPLVTQIEGSSEAVVPESVLPFVVPERDAGEQFKQWVASRWFAPNDLALRASRAHMDGVYLPYYTYDADTWTQYRGERGTTYYVTETYRDSEGNTQTRQVQKIRWSSVSGSVRLFFDDVLICASSSLPLELIEALEPWDLGALLPFEPAFLSGFMAERAALSLEDGFGIAKQKMGPGIHSAICSDIGGDRQRISVSHTDYQTPTFKLCLLPLWLSSFRYEGKVYRFIINARTGEASGERPYSTIKIVLAVLGGVLVVSLLAFLWVRFSS